MASETVVPDQSTDEQVEKKVNEEIKAVEQESVSPSKENGGTDEEEKPKAEELPSPEDPVVESEEKTEDKKIDQPAVVEIEKAEKVDDSLGSDAPTEDGPKIIEDPGPKADVSAVSELTVEIEAEEQAKISDAPESAVETVDKPMEHLEVPPAQEQVDKPMEHMEVLPTQEPEPEVGKNPEQVFESEPKIVEEPESVVEIDEKPQEQAEDIEEVEKKSLTLEPKESMEDEMVKDRGALANKVEEVTESLNEEQSSKDQEPVASEISDTVVSISQEAPSDPKEDGGVSVFPDVVEKADVEDTKKECGVDLVEGLSKEAALEVGKVEEEKEENNVKIEEEKEEKNVKVEDSTQPETTKTEHVSDSNSATEVTEKHFEGEDSSRDVEVVTEEKKLEDVKDDVTTSVETTKDRDIEGKVDLDNTVITVNEQVEEPKELEFEAKAQDSVETGVDTLGKASEAFEEISKFAKSDVPSLESSKDVDDSKTDGDPPKQEVPAKPQKQSNNIISKVKQSIVKVKKAIIGKSPSSKTLSSEAKGDIKVK